MFPAPVASTTKPSAPAARRASIGVPSIATAALTRWTRSAARVVATCRRGPRVRTIVTSPASIRPSGPVLRLRNVSNALAWTFMTSSAGSIVPARTTTTPAPLSAGAEAARTASRRFAGPSNDGCSDVRIAPVTTIGLEPSWSRSKKKAVSSITSVPWTTTAPVVSGSASAACTVSWMSNSAGNVKWLAGVRPRSMATTSAIASRPGVAARIPSPSGSGHCRRRPGRGAC